MRQLIELFERILVLELAAQVLHNPHAHDILEVTVAVMVAALIREVVLAAHLRAVWDQALDAHQRPRAGAQVDAVI